MGLDNIKRVLERLEETGAVIDRTVRVINHFSHNGGPLHERLEKLAAEIGCIASYDGMVVEF
jgi:phosphoribosyl 1,2-cyclic phosphate phosphodiesterase